FQRKSTLSPTTDLYTQVFEPELSKNCKHLKKGLQHLVIEVESYLYDDTLRERFHWLLPPIRVFTTLLAA
ncbi:MAG: hypothetical protein R6X05_10285, partial [Desulfobacterales bacterium]